MRGLIRSALVCVVAVVALVGAASGGPASENCTNGIDDDGDFAVDCGDSNCAAHPDCDFGSGCCILTDCERSAHDGGGAGRPSGETTVRCFGDFTRQECESRFSGAVDPGGGGATVPQCPVFELFEGSCSLQPGCPEFSASVPVASTLGVSSLALCLAAAGFWYLRTKHS